MDVRPEELPLELEPALPDFAELPRLLPPLLAGLLFDELPLADPLPAAALFPAVVFFPLPVLAALLATGDCFGSFGEDVAADVLLLDLEPAFELTPALELSLFEELPLFEELSLPLELRLVLELPPVEELLPVLEPAPVLELRLTGAFSLALEPRPEVPVLPDVPVPEAPAPEVLRLEVPRPEVLRLELPVPEVLLVLFFEEDEEAVFDPLPDGDLLPDRLREEPAEDRLFFVPFSPSSPPIPTFSATDFTASVIT